MTAPDEIGFPGDEIGLPDEIIVTCAGQPKKPPHRSRQIAAFGHAERWHIGEPDGGTIYTDFWYFKESLTYRHGAKDPQTGLVAWWNPPSVNRRLSKWMPGWDALGHMLFYCPSQGCPDIDIGYDKVLAACRLLKGDGRHAVTAHEFRAAAAQIV